MQSICFTGMGHVLPRRMLGNDDLPPLDKPITDAQLERIGVYRRGWAGDGESIPELAAAAALPEGKIVEAVARLEMWIGGVPAAEAMGHIRKALRAWDRDGLEAMRAWFPDDS